MSPSALVLASPALSMRGGEPLDERRASPSGFRRRFLLFATSCSLTPGDAARGWVGPGGGLGHCQSRYRPNMTLPDRGKSTEVIGVINQLRRDSPWNEVITGLRVQRPCDIRSHRRHSGGQGSHSSCVYLLGGRRAHYPAQSPGPERARAASQKRRLLPGRPEHRPFGALKSICIWATSLTLPMGHSPTK